MKAPSAEEGDNFANRSNEKPSELLDLEQVDCSPFIHYNHISNVLEGKYRGTLGDLDRRLLQETMTLVTRESRWVMEHAQITVKGKDMKVVFYSGQKTNKYVVHLTGEDRPTHEVDEKGRWLQFRDGVVTIWSCATKNVAQVSWVFGLCQMALAAMKWKFQFPKFDENKNPDPGPRKQKKKK